MVAPAASGITVTWVARVTSTTKKKPPDSLPQRATPDRTALRIRRKPIRRSESVHAPAPSPENVQADDQWSPSPRADDGIDAETFRKGFERRVDTLATAPAMQLTFREPTLLGRLSERARAVTCAELRAALNAPENAGSALGVIVRTLQERGCYPPAPSR